MKALLLVATVFLCGCASSEHISLRAGPSQQSMTRDGIPALYSTERQIVMLRPVQSSVRRGDRPAFIVAVYNRGRNPTNLMVSGISATSNVGTAIHVYGYDELVAEAKRKQRWATFAVALAGAAGAMNAANAGYTHTYGTYSGYSHGTYSGALNGSYTGTTTGIYSATTYDPARAYAAQSINNAQTAANLAAIQARGEQTLGELQNTILKDNTVMPGEWVGGVVVLDTPEKAPDGMSQYNINVEFGGEVHSFAVSQARAG